MTAGADINDDQDNVTQGIPGIPEDIQRVTPRPRPQGDQAQDLNQAIEEFQKQMQQNQQKQEEEGVDVPTPDPDPPPPPEPPAE